MVNSNTYFSRFGRILYSMIILSYTAGLRFLIHASNEYASATKMLRCLIETSIKKKTLFNKLEGIEGCRF